MPEAKMGKVVHHDTQLGVAIVAVTDGAPRIGDQMHVKGHSTDLEQPVESLAIETQTLAEGLPGQTVGITV